MFQKVWERYRGLAPVAKASLWFVFCNLMLKGISFFSAPVFTRLLSDEEYGRLSIFLSFEQLLLILATWEIQLGTYQRGIFKYKNDIEIYTTSTQALINLLTVAFFILVVSFHSIFQKLTGFSFKIMGLLCLYYMVRPAYDCWLIRKRAAYEYKPAVFMTILYSLVNVIVPIGALLLIERTAEIKISATLIASTLICACMFFPHANYLKLYLHRERVKEYWSYTIKFVIPLMLNGLSYLVLGQADRVMIGRMVGDAQAAYYSIAYSLATTVNIVQDAINQVVIPWRYQKMEDRQFDDIRNASNALLIGVGGMILMFILIMPEVIGVLFPQTYYEAVWCIPPISASVYFMFLYSLFVSFETYYEQTKYVMYVSVTCGLLNIVLNYFCIKRFGYVVCAYTTLFSYICFAAGHYYFSHKLIKKREPNAAIFDVKIICVISCVLLVASIGITLIYPYAYIRYGILLVAVGIAFLCRNKIWDVLRRIKLDN